MGRCDAWRGVAAGRGSGCGTRETGLDAPRLRGRAVRGRGTVRAVGRGRGTGAQDGAGSCAGTVAPALAAGAVRGACPLIYRGPPRHGAERDGRRAAGEAHDTG